MKKQFVNGYGSKHNDGIVTAILIGICVFTVIITVVAARLIIGTPALDTTDNVIADNIDSKEYTHISASEENVEVVEASGEQVSEKENAEKIYDAPCNGSLLKEFSVSMPLYSETLDDWRIHCGIDISSELGQSVKAIADGVVTDSYDDFKNGATVVIEHDDGIKSVYSNLENTDLVNKGQAVFRGDVIGRVGDTTLFETVADTHLHMEILLNGEYVNPLDYFQLSE